MRKGSYSEELVRIVKTVPSLQRNKHEELVEILCDHVGIPAPHQAMKCQGKRRGVRGERVMRTGVANSNITVTWAVTRVNHCIVCLRSNAETRK